MKVTREGVLWNLQPEREISTEERRRINRPPAEADGLSGCELCCCFRARLLQGGGPLDRLYCLYEPRLLRRRSHRKVNPAGQQLGRSPSVRALPGRLRQSVAALRALSKNIAPDMADRHDLERNGLSRRRRIGQVLDRQAVAKNDAAPEVSVPVQTRAGIGPDDLPALAEWSQRLPAPMAKSRK